MQKTIKMMIAGLALVASAHASAEILLRGSDHLVDGTWLLTSRTCLNTDQWIPTDAFQMGRDEAKVEIKGTFGSAIVRINGETTVQGLNVNQREQVIFYRRGQDSYVVETDGSLSVMSGDFGPGGSCPKGATLRSNFIKVN